MSVDFNLITRFVMEYHTVIKRLLPLFLPLLLLAHFSLSAPPPSLFRFFALCQNNEYLDRSFEQVSLSLQQAWTPKMPTKYLKHIKALIQH